VLGATDKKICRVLVEIDIHAGLLESLDIVWRGYHWSQPLDYLGIPFRCSLCRKTRHLRRDCQGSSEEEVSEGTMLDRTTRVESPDVDSCRFSPSGLESPEPSQLAHSDTLTGKLKSICPSLFFSLTSWERSFMDSSSSLGVQGGNKPVSTSGQDPTVLSSKVPLAGVRVGGNTSFETLFETRGESDHHLDLIGGRFC
jgi:hypothetical protein